VDGTGALRPKFDKDFDTEQNSDRDVFWSLSRSVGLDRAPDDPNVGKMVAEATAARDADLAYPRNDAVPDLSRD
jgi:hypothetical protein